MASSATIRIVQRRSANGSNPSQRETLRSLGLRGIRSRTERPDSPQLRGMINVVSHLVEVSEADGKKAPREDGGDG